MTALSAKAALHEAIPSLRTYRLGGIVISTEIALPGVREIRDAGSGTLRVRERGAEDFQAELKNLIRPQAQALYEELSVPFGTYIRWQQDIECLVDRGGETILYRKIKPDLGEAALRSFVLGHVFSHALTLQGIETLHATATVIGGAAVAFLGNCGYGKSTLATWLLHCGLPLMTDDILAIHHESGQPIAHPGLPQIKLLADSAKLLFDPAAGVPVCSGATKLIFPLPPESYWDRAAPLGAIYLLTPPEQASDAIVIEPVLGSAAFVRLMENIFVDSIVETARQVRLFALLKRLCSEIPVNSLSYPRRQEIMPEVVARIVGDSRERAR